METNDKKRIDKVRSNYSGIYTTFIQLQWCNKRMWEQQACVGAISSCRCNNLLSLEQIHVGAISFFRCNKLTWVQQAPFCASIARSHSTPRLLQRCSTTLPHVSFASAEANVRVAAGGGGRGGVGQRHKIGGVGGFGAFECFAVAFECFAIARHDFFLWSCLSFF